MKWINVKDTMPNTLRDVLVTDGEYMTVAYNDHSDWAPANIVSSYEVSTVQFDMGTITHWRELPKLP